MPRSSWKIALVVLCAACGGGLAVPGGDGSAGGGSGGGAGGGGAAGLSTPGNPDGHCSAALPAEAALADVAHPAAVVGTGTAAICTEGALAAAIAGGGVVTFACGADPVTIALTRTVDLPTDRDTVLDGGGKVTLDGGGAVRLLSWASGDWMRNPHVLTLQRLTLARGKAAPTAAIPTAPAPCSQGWDDGQGGALTMRDGTLRAVEVTFSGNEAAPLGPDTGGGAVYLLGVRPSLFVRCSFLGNQGSNGGGLGSLFATIGIYDSLFDGNVATGHGANDDKQAQCAVKRPNGQYQVGSGGNGGAVCNDGVGTSLTLCGTQIRHNHAGDGAYGAAVFMTSNDPANKGALVIRDSHFWDNTAQTTWWQWKPGVSTNATTPDPINSLFE